MRILTAALKQHIAAQNYLVNCIKFRLLYYSLEILPT